MNVYEKRNFIIDLFSSTKSVKKTKWSFSDYGAYFSYFDLLVIQCFYQY